MSFTQETSTNGSFIGTRAEKALDSSSSVCSVASGTTYQMPMVGKNRTPANTQTDRTPAMTTTRPPVPYPPVNLTNTTPAPKDKTRNSVPNTRTPTASAAAPSSAPAAPSTSGNPVYRTFPVNLPTSSPVNKDKTRNSVPNTRTPTASAAAPSSAHATPSTSGNPSAPNADDSWTDVQSKVLSLTSKRLTGTFRYMNKNRTLVSVPMRYNDGRVKDVAYCATWFALAFTCDKSTPTCACPEHKSKHCFKHLLRGCDGTCPFPHIICETIKPAQPTQPTTQSAKQPTTRFAPLATLPESAEPMPAMFTSSTFPAMSTFTSTSTTASARSAPKPLSSYAKVVSAPAKPTPATLASASAKPVSSYASASASASASAKPKNAINREKIKTETCWFVLRGQPCPYKRKGGCAFSHRATTRPLAGLGYREAFDKAFENGWINFQSIFEEVYNALRKGVNDLRTIHGIWLDDSVSKYSFLLNINILVLIENEEIEPCHFADLVKMWFAAACIGRKQGLDRFVLFEDEDGELENQVWEFGRRLQTCFKDADYQRYQSCYGVITTALHALKVPAFIRDKHSRFFNIPKKSLCTFGINCNSGAHCVHKIDTRRLTGLRVREEDDVEPEPVCTDLALVDFRFPKREAQRATVAPVKVISARAKLDAETTNYIRDLTQLVQNEARINELVPDVPAEVAAARAKQGEINSTRSAISAATQRKAKLDSDVSEIENGVIALANLQSEIETKTKNAIGGRYVISQKEERTITHLEKLTKNSVSRIAKLKADSAVQDGLIKHLETVKTTLDAEFVILNKIATRATVMASSDVETQRELNRLTTECDRLTETLVARMRTIEKLNVVVANEQLRGTCPVASYGYQPLRRLPNKAEMVVVVKEADLTDKFFQVSTLAVCEQKRDFAILASRYVPNHVKRLAITLPTTQSEASSASSSAPVKVERVDPALVTKNRFTLPKRVLEELRERQADSENQHVIYKRGPCYVKSCEHHRMSELAAMIRYLYDDESLPTVIFSWLEHGNMTQLLELAHSDVDLASPMYNCYSSTCPYRQLRLSNTPRIMRAIEKAKQMRHEEEIRAAHRATASAANKIAQFERKATLEQEKMLIDTCTHIDSTVELKEETTSSKQTVQKVRPMIQMSCKDYHERVASLTRTIQGLTDDIDRLDRMIEMRRDDVAEAQRDRRNIKSSMEPHLKNIQQTLETSRAKDSAYQLKGKTRSEVKLREIQDGPLASCNDLLIERKTLLADTQRQRTHLIAERRDVKILLDELEMVQPNPALDTEDFVVEYVDSARNNMFSVLQIEDDEVVVVVIIEPFTEDMIEFFACEMNVPTEDPASVEHAKSSKRTKVASSKITITVDQDARTHKCKTTISGMLSDDIKTVCSTLRTKCSTSCAVKKEEIIIAGNLVEIARSMTDRAAERPIETIVKEFIASSGVVIGAITLAGAITSTGGNVRKSKDKTKTKDPLERSLTKTN